MSIRQKTSPPASPIKRLMALFYDSLIITAILFLATFIALLLNGGKSYGPNHFGFLLYLLAVAGIYLMLSWLKGGQTIGMKAWQLKLIHANQGALQKHQVFIRYLASIVGMWCFGLGFLWCFIDKDHQTFADRISGTFMISIKP